MPQLPAPITAARRIGGRPPRSSHCSSTLGQIRAGDGLGQRRRGLLGAREGHRPAEPHLDLARPDPPAAADVFGAEHGGRDHRRAGLQGEAADAALRGRQRAGPDPGALGEDADGAAALDDQAGGLHRVLVGLAAADREGAEPGEDPALPAALEELDLGDVVHRPPPGQGAADHERVEEAAVVGGDDQAALDAAVLAAVAGVAEVDEEERRHEDPGQQVERPVDAVTARVVVVALETLGGHLRGLHGAAPRLPASCRLPGAFDQRRQLLAARARPA